MSVTIIRNKIEILRDMNNNVIGWKEKHSISLLDYGLFTICQVDGKMQTLAELVEPQSIEKVKCNCGGEIRVVKIAIINYEINIELLLQCRTCNGKYIASASGKLNKPKRSKR